MRGWLARLLGRGEAPVAGIALARMHAEASLMALEGVVSIGVGRDKDGAEAIVVGVASAATPVELPESVDGVPVVVREVGRIRADEEVGE